MVRGNKAVVDIDRYAIIPKLTHGDRGQEVPRALVVQDLREVYLDG